MNTKHTPGPWLYEGHPNALIIWSDEKSRSTEICHITPHGDLHNSVGEANARLIAAAPELLEACLFVMKYHNMHLDKADGNELPFQLSDVVKAAIAKAQG